MKWLQTSSYAICGMGAIRHTVNPRLAPDDVALVMHDAGDCVLFADIDFAGLIAGLVPPAFRRCARWSRCAVVTKPRTCRFPQA